MPQSKEINVYMEQLRLEAKQASKVLSQSSLEQKNEALQCISDQIGNHRVEILKENQKDLE